MKRSVTEACISLERPRPEAAKSRGVVATVDVRNVSRNFVKVIDEGIGISDENKTKIFEKFSRLDTPLTRKTQGSGLGLYIVKGLVEGMGGEIRVYSNEECGFCVRVYLPIAVEEKAYE